MLCYYYCYCIVVVVVDYVDEGWRMVLGEGHAGPCPGSAR